MRTTIDLPDALLNRLKPKLAPQNTTMRAFIISAIESKLQNANPQFRLRDAALKINPRKKVSTKTINDAIDSMREEHNGWK